MSDQFSRRHLITSALVGAVASNSLPSVEARRAASVEEGEPVGRAYVDKISYVADPARYTGIDPTGASDSSAGLRRAIADCPEFATLVIPPGTYRVGSSVTNNGKSIRIMADGALFVKASDNSAVFLLTGSYSSTVRVSAVTVVDASSGAGTQKATRLTLASSPAWSRGDVVKLVADDPIPDARNTSTSTASRLGQYFTVISRSGSQLTVAGVPRYPFATNIRVARLNDTSVSIRGARFITDTAGLAAGWTGPTVIFASLLRPVASDLTILDACGAAITFRGCYGYSAVRVSVSSAPDSATSGQFGYGILDNSSAYGAISELTARRVRHAYTDDTTRVAANTIPSNYGSTFGTTVTSSTCDGASGAAFDTHSASDSVTFSNCFAVASQRGFSLRGRRHRVEGCSAVSCESGVAVTTESDGNDHSWGHEIRGFSAQGTRGPAVIVQPHTAASHASSGQREPRPLVLSGLHVRSGSLPQIIVTNSVAVIDDVASVVTDTPPASTPVVQINNSEVTVRGASIDFRGITGGSNLRGMQTRVNSVADVDALSVSWDDSSVGRIGATVVSEDGSIIRVRHARLSSDIATPSQGLTAGSYLNWTTPTANAGFLQVAGEAIAGGETARFISRTTMPTVTVRCETPSQRTFPALLPGAILGQRLVILNSETGAGRVNVRHGADFRTSLAGAATKPVLPGESLTLVWVGTVWREST